MKHTFSLRAIFAQSIGGISCDFTSLNACGIVDIYENSR